LDAAVPTNEVILTATEGTSPTIAAGGAGPAQTGTDGGSQGRPGSGVMLEPAMPIGLLTAVVFGIASALLRWTR